MNQKQMFHSQYLESDIAERIKEYRSGSDDHWKRKGQAMSLSLFRRMSERVPAYRQFLKENRVNPGTIKTYQDLQKVPYTDKSNYVDKYPVDQLCWDGILGNSHMMSASSGSTGLPYFWPRSDEQIFHGALISEAVYRQFLEMDKNSTLYIVSFAMGMWVAGSYMTNSTQWVAQKGYAVTVATPGMNKPEIFKLVEFGDKYYDQIVLIGYPPFVKDVIDSGTEQGIKWKDINLKLMFSGEAFTERWRSHMCEKIDFNIYTDAINIYGSADIGLNAHETPTTVFLRRLAADRENIATALFKSDRIPSVNQYDPVIRHFDTHDQELLVSAPSGIPFVRYNTKDMGGILYYTRAEALLKEQDVDLKSEFSLAAENPDLLWTLPMVYLFGRGKFTTTLYGVNLYPEHIKFILDNARLEKALTGKFDASTRETSDFTQQLRLRIEAREGVDISDATATLVKEIFIRELPGINTEYKKLLESAKEKAHPEIILHKYGDPDYFPKAVIKKTS